MKQFIEIHLLEEQRVPLWLNLACNELRVFGDFRMLDDKIKELPPNINDLFKYILNRINSEYENNIIIEVSFIVFLHLKFYKNSNVFLLNFTTKMCEILRRLRKTKFKKMMKTPSKRRP
jgi:hypothetical protein